MSSYSPPSPQPAAAPQQVANPFSGIPLTDVLRDVAALTLLITALFYDWNAGDYELKWGASLWFVDVATALAALSLLATYLGRLGVFGQAWQVRNNGLIRLFASIPYFISVLVVLILDLADERVVGVGVGIGLVAALLVAQPRRHELPPASLAPSDRVWVYVTGGLVALSAFFALLSSLLFIDDLDKQGTEAGPIVIFVIGAVVYAALLLVVAVPALLSKPAGIALIAALGLLLMVLGMFHIDGQNATQLLGFLTLPYGVETIQFPGFGAFLLIGAAGAALSPGASRATGGAAHPVSLAGAARIGFLVLALAAFLHLLGAVYFGVESDDFAAPVIVTIIFSLLAAVVAALGLVTASSEGPKTLPLIAVGAYAALVTVLAIIVAIIDEGSAGFATSDYEGDVNTDTWLGVILAALLIAVGLIGTEKIGGTVKKVFSNVQAGGPAAGAPLPSAPAPTAPLVTAPAAAPA
ncbi:MAG: hypothetical protein QM597_05875, partial [Aeromicrobium sp.]|uniref:DUF7937 domain-containing protein n=1 Tax=Aeromicrobium sp. TaxID=1871063 RepID=UPI0039E3C86E